MAAAGRRWWLITTLALASLASGCGDDEEEPVPVIEDTGGVLADGETTGEPGDVGNTGGGEDADTTGEPDDVGGTGEDAGTTGGEDTKDAGGQPTGVAVTVTPSIVDFGSTQIGVTKSAQFVIQNTGDEKVNIIKAEFTTGADEGFSYVDEPPTGLLVPGEKRTIDVKFTTSQVGSHTALITFEMLPSPAMPLTVKLKVIATVQPSTVVLELVSSAAGVKFGPVEVGSEKAIEFSLVNSGTSPLQIVDVHWAAGSDADFSFVTDKPVPLILGASSKVGVVATYKPDKAEPDSAVLTVVNSSPNTPELQVPMTGTGFTGACAGTLVCAPQALDFGAALVGQPTGKAVVCSNTGLGPILVTGVDVQLAEADGFTWTEPSLPKLLQSGEGVAVPVVFSPKSLIGEWSGQISVTSDDCDEPTQVIAVSGKGKEAPTPPACLPAGTFAPKVEWEWTADDAEAQLARVFMAPIVISLDDDDGDGDIDGDDTPEVVFVAHNNGLLSLNDDSPGVLRAVHGADGAQMWISGASQRPSWATNLAAAELDGVPGPEIVAIAYAPSPPGQNCPGVPDILPAAFCAKYLTGRLVAYHGVDGSLFWVSDPFSGATTDLENLGGPTLADLDGDGVVEVILGHHVFNGLDGTLMWSGTAGRGNDGHGFMAVVVDVDGNGITNVVAGNTAYEPNGDILWTSTIQDTHGVAATDLDGDGSIEVFVNAPNGNSVIVDGKTGGVLVGPVNTGIIGCCVATPAVADVVLAKPGLEIITVGDDQLKVYDKDLNLIWARDIFDETGAAGPAAFDVEGDGVAEVVYADQSTLWILRGSDGSVLFEADRFSATGLDNPVIADVDGDGHAEILVPLESGVGSPGLRLYANQDDSWVATRRIWNQHAYSITNIYDNGSVPVGGADPALGPLLLRTNQPICK